MNPELPVDPAIRRRNRIMLVSLAVVVLLPVALATLLHVSGWRPTHTRNHGELVNPPVVMSDLEFRTADGAVYDFAPQERRWQIAVVPTPNCGARCTELIAGLDKVWRLQGRRADRLHVLWFGPVPEDAVTFRTFVPMQAVPAFVARLPQLATSGEPSLYLIDPSGFLVMQYAPGVDVADVRADVAQLLK